MELIGIDALKPKRIAQTLRLAASAAPAGVHAVLAVVLPPILPQGAGAGAANPVQADRPTSSPPSTCPTITSPAASMPNSRLKVRGERSPDGSG
ncbi:hypothetical protein AB0D30_31290 [Streptomyces sp. NPDC048409]|uniref:hypothetical protein n=1 Tax=Streptomyces sp. NPDC048409 TaxID=3154723 RepID=UPI00343C71AF